MALLAGCQRYPSGGDVQIRSDMVNQPSFRPQEDPRALPEGAIPVRGFEPPFTQAEAERNFQNPVPGTEQARAQGRRLFSIYCAPCHGAAGRGDGLVAAKMSKPANLQDVKYAQATDGFIYYVIRYGTPIMPPKAEALEPHERWQVIHHVRTLQRR
jgi:mono/diheme cytochrome c family protein